MADVATVAEVGTFDLCHDRAVFHFLTNLQERDAYLDLAAKSIRRALNYGDVCIGWP
jgi:hypothetical protein